MTDAAIDQHQQMQQLAQQQNQHQTQQFANHDGGRYWKRNTVTICSFNVLCKQYEPSHLPNNACAFNVRCQQLESQIRWSNADVIFLCEVNPVSWYQRTFRDLYDILYVSKQDNTYESQPSKNNESTLSEHEMRNNINDVEDGCCFMFKKGTVEIIKVHHILLQDPHPNDSQLAPGNQRARQCALVAHVLHIASKKTFFVCGSHFKANGGGREEDGKRICHIKQIFSKLNTQIRVRDPSAPLFLCGDLNATPQSPTLQLLLAGRTHLAGGQHLLGQSSFVSAMKMLSEDGDEEAPFTILDSSWSGELFHAVLDYILFEKSAADQGRVIPVGCLTPPQLELYGTDAIPFSGSDHIPLVCEFLIR